MLALNWELAMAAKWQNGQPGNDHLYDQAVLYASELFTVHDYGYSKHYFMEGQRIAASIGGQNPNYLVDPYKPLKGISDDIYALQKDYAYKMKQYYVMNDPNSIDLCYWQNNCLTDAMMNPVGNGSVFFYHSDHLGSGTLLTNAHGQVSQVLGYMPFGEELLNVTDRTY